MKRAEMLKDALKKATNPKEKAELQKQLEKSLRGRKSRAKGSSYESKIANIFNTGFEAFGLVLKRTPSSGGFAKAEKNEFVSGDLSCLSPDLYFKLHIECKSQKVIKMREWISQSNSDCVEGKIPTIIFHVSKEMSKLDVGDYITLPLKDFLIIVDGESIIEER